MLKVDKETLERLEERYKGIMESIMSYENAELPPCPSCGSSDTAQVTVGVVGRSISIVSATTKMKLIANPPKPGDYFCNDCKQFFS